MRAKVAIWGAGGHAMVVADILNRAGKYSVAAFLNTLDRVEPGLTIQTLSVFGSFGELKRSIPDVTHMIFGIGSCKARAELAAEVKKQGFAFATAIHPGSIIADVEIGEGTVVSAGAIINSNTKVGANVIINTGATVDHECVIEDAVHLCPGVHLAGKVHVGKGTWVGIGSTVVEKIKIGTGSVIGAGSLVIRDVPDGVIVYGSPAKVQRTVE